MKVATGTVIDGKVVVEGPRLTEGTTVAVMIRDDEESFILSIEEENELLDSMEAIERGDFIFGKELLEKLRRFG